MSGLLSLPPETLDQVLHNLDPIDVAAFSAVCRATRDFCDKEENVHLWSTLFLSLFDPPPPSADHAPFPYFDTLVARIRARGLINLAREDQLPRVVAAFPPVLGTFNTIHQSATAPTSRNIAFLASLFPHDSTAFTSEYLSMYLDLKRGADVAPVTLQAAARFKLLHGPMRLYEPHRRLQALRRVYDLRNYSSRTSFGPFLANGCGTVDWVLLDAIRTVIGNHPTYPICPLRWLILFPLKTIALS